LERLVEPVGRVILRISLMARRLQHGRVQSYVLYILIGLGMLAAWVFLRGLPSFAT
jgi:hydrogenase-4 component B